MKKFILTVLAFVISVTIFSASLPYDTYAIQNQSTGQTQVAAQEDSGSTYKEISNETPNYGSDADDGCVETALFGQVCGKEGIFTILHFVIDIMTVGVGILAVIGISIAGIQYLTAGGNEEQTRKAKRRILEIVIGLAIYVVFFALLSWILPDYGESIQELNYQNTTSSEIG